jgi:hypothetical protein
VSFVWGLAMAAVNVVDMVAGGDGLVATVVARTMAVFRVLDMRDVAPIPVVIVALERVAVVDVVGVVVVVDADVAAAGVVPVSVVGVGGVRRTGLRTERRDRTTARLVSRRAPIYASGAVSDPALAYRSTDQLAPGLLSSYWCEHVR